MKGFSSDVTDNSVCFCYKLTKVNAVWGNPYILWIRNRRKYGMVVIYF